MSQAIGVAFEQHQRLIWGLCYRMLGTTVDADEVVQEAFARALQRRPDEERPLRPWLVKVACNLSRDRLRKRRRRRYTGPWLPSPLDTGPAEAVEWIRQPELEPLAPDARYELLESVSFAWLLALEALTPAQRAVLILRDVLELSTAETAEAMEMSASNVKVTLHRARRALAPYHASAEPPSPARQAEAATLIAQLGAALQAGDLDAIKALLADDVTAASDGGGVYHAARNVLQGPDRVARLFVGLLAMDPTARMEPRLLNGMPGVVLERSETRPGFARRSVTLIDIRDGRIHRFWSVLAPGKLHESAPVA